MNGSDVRMNFDKYNTTILTAGNFPTEMKTECKCKK